MNQNLSKIYLHTLYPLHIKSFKLDQIMSLNCVIQYNLKIHGYNSSLKLLVIP